MFQSNIISIYGEKGKAWLNELPELVSGIASSLKLRDLKEVTNLTYNYVLSGLQGDSPIILKLGLDNDALAREAFTLKCFAGYGVVKVLAENAGVLLLNQAVPGGSLKSYFRDKEHESIKIACHIIKKLHQANIPTTHTFPHIKDWLTALDKDWNISKDCLQKARNLKDHLLETSETDILLHGDLHHDNILQNSADEARHSFSDDGWLVIDPKGVIGEPAYEVGAFIRNPMPELLNHADVSNIIHDRITRFSELLGIPAKRIHDWCFVQAVLSWVWGLEDNCDTVYFERLTKVLKEFV